MLLRLTVWVAAPSVFFKPKETLIGMVYACLSLTFKNHSTLRNCTRARSNYYFEGDEEVMSISGWRLRFKLCDC